MVSKLVSGLLFILLFAVPVAAVEIGGVEVEQEVVQSDGTVLRLNGAGIRSKFFFKIYVASLYLENVNKDSLAVIADTGGKRIVMHFLYSEVEGADLVEAWNAGFEGNGSKDQLEKLSEEIAAFNKLFVTVKEGDRIILDYVPEVGTSVEIRGESKGVIAGKAFNDLLLSIWLGNEPVGDDLKAALLGT